MEPKLFTTPQAASQLQVSNSHMRTMIRTGIAKPIMRLGNGWVFTQDEIERLRTRNKSVGRPKKTN